MGEPDTIPTYLAKILESLGRMDEKLTYYHDERVRDAAQVADLTQRVLVLETHAAVQTGFWSGAKWLWGTLMALPVGAIAYLLGQQ